MESYRYLLDIALILLGTKLFGIFSKKLRMPAVVGALVAGIVLGPAMLNLVEPNTIITALSELGVLVIMFSAGLEMDNGISVPSVISGNGFQAVYAHDNVFQRLLFGADFRVFRAGVDDNHVIDGNGHRLSREA